MNDADFVDNFSILLFEGSSAHGNRFEEWLTGVPTKRAASLKDIFREFDSSVAVACLSQSLLEHAEAEIRRFILNRNPYCQLVLLAPHQSSNVLYEQHYDAVITRPVSKEELQTTVETRLKYGMYSALLDEFYTVNAELLSLQRADSSEADLDQNEMKKRLQRVRVPLQRLTSAIDHTEMKELLESLNLHRGYMTEPAQSIDTSAVSKYHPDACSHCKLPWGVDHRNALGNGFSQLGAYVWRCEKCMKITHGSDPSGRRVARR